MITNKLKLLLGIFAIGTTAVGTTIAMYNGTVYPSGALFAEQNVFQCSTVLTRAETGVTSSNYVNWSYSPTNNEKEYTFIGQSAGSYNSIQLRSDKSLSGIVTNNTSLGLASILLEWNENTAIGRTVEIYGRIGEQYTIPANLYNNSAEKLGEIVYGTSTSLMFDKKYTSYGLRSKSGALYLDSITFNWTNALPTAELEIPPEQSSSNSNSNSSSSSTVSEIEENGITIHPTDFTATIEDDYSYTIEGVTVAVTASTVTAEQIRIYKNQKITISSDKNITSIKFICTANGTAKYGPGCFAAQSGYSYNDKNGIWTGNANSVTFTASSAQVRITEITITIQSN